MLVERVVDVDLLVPVVGGGGPALGNAEQVDVVDDVATAHVEDGVVGLADKVGTHGDEAGVAQRLPILRRPVVVDQVFHLLFNNKQKQNIVLLCAQPHNWVPTTYIKKQKFTPVKKLLSQVS